MRGDETVSAEASSTALAIITETINRNHLNRDDPIQGDPLTDATAAELWVDRARVLHELIGSALTEEETARGVIAQVADLAAVAFEVLAINRGEDALTVVQQLALSWEARRE
jgi:hypothetical protein